jgi:DNA-directed RNA polymerase specialized sigma24 family protein
MRAYVRAFRGGARNVDAGVFPSLVEALARAAHVAPEIAEDVAADVLHRHIGRVGARSALLNIPSVAAYLRLSAQRRAGQQARRGMHELVLPEIESSEFESLSIADEAPRAVDAIDLAAAVARLPARQRKDLIAVWLEDRPEVDVASATGRTPQAVSQSVKAGLKNLRKILAGGG